MEPTSLYGYVPTHWLAIFLGVSCIFTSMTGIPTLFFKYPNRALGTFVVLGTGFQLVGHVCMAVSSFQPTNQIPWALQLGAFQWGKCFARFAGFVAYYTCFNNLKHTGTSSEKKIWFKEQIFLTVISSVAGFCFGFRFFCLVDIMVDIWMKYKYGESGPLLFGRITLHACNFLLLTTTLCLLALLVFVVCRTRKQTLWFRLTWMTGYYFTLLMIPVFFLIQDVYDVVRSFVSYRNEMLDLFGDMGMTKSILVLLAFQYYELAYAWSQRETRPKWLESIKLQVREVFLMKGGEEALEQQEQPHRFPEV